MEFRENKANLLADIAILICNMNSFSNHFDQNASLAGRARGAI